MEVVVAVEKENEIEERFFYAFAGIEGDLARFVRLRNVCRLYIQVSRDPIHSLIVTLQGSFEIPCTSLIKETLQSLCDRSFNHLFD